MVVYRVCREDEVNKIIGGCDLSILGHRFSMNDMRKRNTHQYDSSQLYLHFFQNKSDILYLRTRKGNYLCTYDIPNEILEKYEGIGYYYDLLNYSTLYNIREYAIKNTDLSIDYLLEIEYITDEMDIDDYLDDQELTNFFELRYRKDDAKKLIRVN